MGKNPAITANDVYKTETGNQFNLASILNAFQKHSNCNTITWQIINDLLDIYVNTRWLVLNKDFASAWKTIATFIQFEAELFDVLSQKNNYSATIVKCLSEIQLKYNRYRTGLLKDIRKLLLDDYKRAIQNYSTNYLLSIKILSEIEEIIEFFKSRIKLSLDQSKNSVQQVLSQCYDVFIAIQSKGDNLLLEVTKEQSEHSSKDKMIVSNISSDNPTTKNFEVRLTIGKKINQAKNWNRLQIQNKSLLDQFKNKKINQEKIGPESIEKIEQFKEKQKTRNIAKQ